MTPDERIAELESDNARLRRDLEWAYNRIAAASEVLSKAAERTGTDLPLAVEELQALRDENAALRSELERFRNPPRVVRPVFPLRAEDYE